MSRSDKFYTIEEATDMLGVSEQEIMNMISTKKLPAVKIEKSIKIREEDMEKFLDSLGRKDKASSDDVQDETRIITEAKDAKDVFNGGKIKNGYRIREGLEKDKVCLEKTYKELLRKKQELEEDINYLQYKYDEFKSRIRKIISEEFKLFLKKIDEDNLLLGNEILENDFNGNLDVDKDTGKVEEDEKNDYNDDKEEMFVEDDKNETNIKNLVSEKDDQIELKESKADDL